MTVAAVMSGEDEKKTALESVVSETASASPTATSAATTDTEPPVATPGTTTRAPQPTTAAPAPPVPKTPAPKVYRGRGDKVVKFRPVITDSLLMTTSWTGADGNITIYALSPDGDEDDLLVNAIESYSGQALFNPQGSEVAGLKIEGGGSWTVKLASLTTAKRWNGSGTYSGKSDGVVNVASSFDPLDSIEFVSTNSDSNVTMYAYDSDGDADLVVNDIGNFKGEHLVPNDSVLFVINSDGRWTIKKT
ncbi:hypothetical protein [Couchioplanes caeruleus]|nr:hypothetical protein [Couchioplanes caeruleus]